MKVLIINSDSPNNRGDRAILEGNIKLIRKSWPKAEIWALSEYNERDEAWYGINFLPYGAYTTSLTHIVKIAFFARKCDYVFWGGGEILKDYTNRLGIAYWLFRMRLVRLFNPNIYGAFQGIGPTSAASSKKRIVRAVNLTKIFFTRDEESKQKLEQWGVKTRVISSFDPAVLNTPGKLDTKTKQLIRDSFDISEAFLGNAVGVGLRRWFHYKKGGLVPYKFRFWEDKNKQNVSNPKLEEYTRNTAELLDRVVEKHDVNIVFFPMFNAPSEGDDQFSRSVIAHMQHASRTRIIDQDNLSPQQYQNVVARCKVFIAARLHSSIIATSSLVPAVVFYYVDKGRLYFEQMGMEKFSQPIEDLLDAKNLKRFESQVSELLKNDKNIRKQLNQNIDTMRQKLFDDFSNVGSQK